MENDRSFLSASGAIGNFKLENCRHFDFFLQKGLKDMETEKRIQFENFNILRIYKPLNVVKYKNSLFCTSKCPNLILFACFVNSFYSLYTDIDNFHLLTYLTWLLYLLVKIADNLALVLAHSRGSRRFIKSVLELFLKTKNNQYIKVDSNKTIRSAYA